MSLPPSPPVVDAREASRARQPGRALAEVVVTVTQTATGRRQAVRVAAPDERHARALAMMHSTLLEGVPRDLSPASLALRDLDFQTRADDGGPVVAPAPAPAGDVAPANGSPSRPARPVPAGEYGGYAVVVATDPLYWTTEATEPSAPEARLRAGLLADMAREAFPGLRCDLVAGPVEKLDLSEGPDPATRERLEAWVDTRMAEMLGVARTTAETASEEEAEEEGCRMGL